MSDQRVYLDDIYASKACGGSIFRAVVMMAHEARFINEQARLGYLQLTKKPTTIAMYKFKENKLAMTELEEVPADQASAAAVSEAAPAAVSKADDEKADSAFGG